MSASDISSISGDYSENSHVILIDNGDTPSPLRGVTSMALNSDPDSIEIISRHDTEDEVLSRHDTDDGNFSRHDTEDGNFYFNVQNEDETASDSMVPKPVPAKDLTPEQKWVARTVSVVAVVMFTVSLVLVGVSFTMADHINELVRNANKFVSRSPSSSSSSSKSAKVMEGVTQPWTANITTS